MGSRSGSGKLWRLWEADLEDLEDLDYNMRISVQKKGPGPVPDDVDSGDRGSDCDRFDIGD